MAWNLPWSGIWGTLSLLCPLSLDRRKCRDTEKAPFFFGYGALSRWLKYNKQLNAPAECTYCARKNTPKISNTNSCYYVSALRALYLIINCLFWADDSSVLQIFARHSFLVASKQAPQCCSMKNVRVSCCYHHHQHHRYVARSINCCLRTKAIIKPLVAQYHAKWWIVTLCNSHLLEVAGSKSRRWNCRNGARTTTERPVDGRIGRVAEESRQMG